MDQNTIRHLIESLRKKARIIELIVELGGMVRISEDETPSELRFRARMLELLDGLGMYKENNPFFI